MRRLFCIGLAALLAAGVMVSPATAAKACKKPRFSGAGGDAEVVKVTDKHTESKPLQATINVDPGFALFGDEPTYTHGYLNVQVDSKAKLRGLWVSIAVPPMRDYDLYLLDGDAAIADSNGWNPGHVLPMYTDLIGDQSDNGGETTLESETITGFATADCSGYTVDAAVALGEGGAVPVTIWLGEIAF